MNAYCTRYNHGMVLVVKTSCKINLSKMISLIRNKTINTFESAMIYAWIISHNFERWCPFQNTAARDVGGNHTYLNAKPEFIKRLCENTLLFTQQIFLDIFSYYIDKTKRCYHDTFIKQV